MARPKSIPAFADLPGNVSYKIPDGDNRIRAICDDCGFINYINPRVVVGAVCTFEEKYLLCRRAIQPREGYWTIPAGYLEEEETTEAGASRESMEEAGVDIQIDSLLAVYSIPRISQVQIIYRATLPSAALDPGPESSEAEFFSWDQIPWKDLAFPSVNWALAHHREVAGLAGYAPKTSPEGGSGEFVALGL